jgi:hypothetical protein
MPEDEQWALAEDPIAAFNQVLSEILDVVQVAKQADRKVPPADPIHPELDRLLSDLVSWARRLMDQDDAFGVSALSYMPSAAGRHPSAPWPGAPSDDQVRAVLDDLLGRLEQHLDTVLARQDDASAREALIDVGRQLRAHRGALAIT